MGSMEVPLPQRLRLGLCESRELWTGLVSGGGEAWWTEWT